MEDVTSSVNRIPIAFSQWQDPQLLGVIVAVFAVIVTLVLFSLYFKKRVRRQNVLFVGLSDSGKTLLFVRLAYNKYFDTHTSLKENRTEYNAGNRTIQLVDVPGQERVRNRILDVYKSSTLGVVFVIDSLTVQRELRDVAEYLYNILTDEAIQSIRPPVLILCNKQDQPMAKGSAAVRALLQKEINTLRKTKTSQLQSIDNKYSGAYLGKEGKDFDFDHLSPMEVTFAESTAVMAGEEESPDLSQLEDWLGDVA